MATNTFFLAISWITVVLVQLVCSQQPTLTDQLVVTSITSPTNILTASWTRPLGWRTSTQQPAPIFTSIVSDGTIYVAWSGTNESYVTTVSSKSVVGAIRPIGAYSVRGFAAHDDGSFVVLAWAAPALSLHKYTSTGLVWAVPLETDRCVDFDIGSSNLVVAPAPVELTLAKYGVYYKVLNTNSPGSCSTNGERSDSVKYLEADGSLLASLSLCTGCTHSMASIIAFNPESSEFLPVCLTDCVPSASHAGLVASFAQPDIIDEFYGDCNLGYAGDLGAVVPYGDGFLVGFSGVNGSFLNPALNSGAQYEASVWHLMKEDEIWQPISKSPLFTTPQNEIVAHLAKFNGPWTNDTFLVGVIREWCNATNWCTRHFVISMFGSSELLQLSLEERIVRPEAFFGERTLFSSGANGDVAWAYPQALADGGMEGVPVIHVVRVKAIGPPPADCYGIQPRSDFECVNGTWTARASVTLSGSTITIDTNIAIKGDLYISTSSEFRMTPGVRVEVQGCVLLKGTLVFQLYRREDYDALVANPSRSLFHSAANCIQGDFSVIRTQLLFSGVCTNTAYPPPNDCVCLGHPEETPAIDSGFYKVDWSFDDAHCKEQPVAWWLILIIVVCGVLTIAVIVTMIILLHPTIKQKVFPVERVE